MELTYSRYKNTTKWNEKNGVTFLTFAEWDRLGVKHGFSTRLGGMSIGAFSSMNLSFTRGDDREAVMENHVRFAKAVGYDGERLVLSDQVHGNKIYKVTEDDVGKGITKESDIKNMDGLMTNVKDVPLMTFYADCVPLFFYDPKRKVVGLAHAGWRGTVLCIGGRMLEAMDKEYGCRPEDVYVAIGPSICGECYEVGVDVVDRFLEECSYAELDRIVKKRKNGKYWVDLWEANEIMLLRMGVKESKITKTDLCTCHNPELFYSHRVNKGERGSLAAVIML